MTNPPYSINNYRTRKFGNKFFVTTESGSWAVLSENELKNLKKEKIDKKLLEKLKEKEIILTDENMKNFEEDLAKRNSFLFFGTSLHIIVITERCNMNCIYCHASSEPLNAKGYDMDKDTAKKTIDFIFQSPNKKITIEFQGGEPLLNWEIMKYMIEYAYEKNKKEKKDLRITLVTNLSLMDEEKMDYLIEKKVGVCTSLDGPKKIHDYNRRFGKKSNYEQVIKWIKKFQEEYKKRKKDMEINALVTLTKKSLAYPKEIVDEYVKNGLKIIHLRFLNKLGIAKKSWPKISYSVEDYLKFWKKSVGHIEKLQKEKKEIKERIVEIMLQKIRDRFDPGYLDLRSPCGAVIGQLSYNYNGDIYTCDEARMIEEDLFLLGNVKKDNYKDIVTSDKACAIINSSLNYQYICDDCVYRPYCGICPVCNYAEQGNIIAKIPETPRCKIYKAQFDWVVGEKFIK